MASKRRISKAEQAARAAQSNQYVRRLIEDESLRNNLLDAYASARKAADRVGNGKKPSAKSLMGDKKLQRDLKHTGDSLKNASSALKHGPKKRRRRAGGIGGVVMLTLVGAGAALALSESLRSKLLDLMFGAEEEFDYSSTTAPATEAPSSAAAPSS